MSPTLHHARTWTWWSIRQWPLLILGTLPMGMVGFYWHELGLNEEPVPGFLLVAICGIAAMMPAASAPIATLHEPKGVNSTPCGPRATRVIPLGEARRVIAEVAGPFVLTAAVAAVLWTTAGRLAPHVGQPWADLLAFGLVPPATLGIAVAFCLPGWVAASRSEAGGVTEAAFLVAPFVGFVAGLIAALGLLMDAPPAPLFSALVVFAYLAQPRTEQARQWLARRLRAKPGAGRPVPRLDRDVRWQLRATSGFWRGLLLLLAAPGAVLLPVGLAIDGQGAILLGSLLLMAGIGTASWVLILHPLGLKGQVVSSQGVVQGYNGEMLRAFSVLPTRPRELRRASLRAAFWGPVWALVVLAAPAVGFSLLVGPENAAPAVASFAILWAFSIGLAPLGTAFVFGRQRHWWLSIAPLVLGVAVLYASILSEEVEAVVLGGGIVTWTLGSVFAALQIALWTSLWLDDQ